MAWKNRKSDILGQIYRKITKIRFFNKKKRKENFLTITIESGVKFYTFKKKFHTKNRAFYVQKGEKSIFSLISYILLLKVGKITTHFEEASGFFIKYAPRDAEIRF